MRKIFFLAALALLGLLIPQPVWSQQPQTVDVGTGIQPLIRQNSSWVNGWAQGYWPTSTGTNLVVNIGPGTSNYGGVITSYTGGTVTVGASTTTYIYVLAASGVVTSNTSGFTSAHYPIAIVVSGSSAVSTIQDVRGSFSNPGGTGGGAVYPGSPGIAVWNGTTWGSPATASTIIGLWGSGCTGTNRLAADGNCYAAGGMTWPATPGIMIYAGSSAYGTSIAIPANAAEYLNGSGAFAFIGSQSRNVTTSSDTIASTDTAGGVIYLYAGATAVSLPTTTTLGNTKFAVNLHNSSSGTVTVTPASSWPIYPQGIAADSEATLAILSGQTCFIEANIAGSIWNSYCRESVIGGTGFTRSPLGLTLSGGSGGMLSLGAITYTSGGTTTFAAASNAIGAGGTVTTTHSTSTTLSPTGLVVWGSYVLEIIQDGTGGGVTFTLGTGGSCSAWKVGGGGSGAITLSTAPNAIDVLTFTYDGTYCVANFRQLFN